MRVSGVRRFIDLPPAGGEKLGEGACVPLTAVAGGQMLFANDAADLIEPGSCGQDRVFASFAVELENIDVPTFFDQGVERGRGDAQAAWSERDGKHVEDAGDGDVRGVARFQIVGMQLDLRRAVEYRHLVDLDAITVGR